MKKNTTLVGFLLLLLLLMTGCESSSKNDGSSHINFLWKMEDETVFSNVNCSLYKVTDKIYQCDYSWKLTPSLTPIDPDYPEVKIETTFSPARNPNTFAKWIVANRVFIDIYVSSESNLNSCFVYVWDEKAYFDPDIKNGWVDGVFYQGVFNNGWNRVVLPLTFRIKDLDASRPETYKIGFGFRHLAEGQEEFKQNGYPLNKVPIFLGGIGVF
ncbi:MAG TPA: hypothetical protein DEB05_04585 [Firmicutes bacterium]|nr:hypothetical protein [Bacillota bacterium]